MRDSLFDTFSPCPQLLHSCGTRHRPSFANVAHGGRSEEAHTLGEFAEQEEIEMVTKECVFKAIEAIADFVHEHHGHLMVQDVARLTLALREQSHFECVIGVPGLYSIDAGTTKQIVRVRIYQGVHSNELTDSLIARILDGNAWTHDVSQ
ncbi:hypothetical protein A2839_04745 [Candidatus Uhrbacteria bacterium RIFCSPHIGHO2_01_FULL_47_10]|nr:MAG: hypothetical protein A2839_04745 [Candidatus Uhrbacteria bacterium RIFCSPHIGHO2_01_FULL_47_10]